jgi:hypothetical protein
MSPGIPLFAKPRATARNASSMAHLAPGGAATAEHLFLRIALATLPLIGLVVGVVGVAVWTAH